MNNTTPKTTEYLSLGEAAKYCNYSPDYLKLRARQGKLMAIKIGRNWATKKEWLDEYISSLSVRRRQSARTNLFILSFLILAVFGLAFTIGTILSESENHAYFQWISSQFSSANISDFFIPSRIIEIK